jgi:4-amino-4-deoxy-L-arabinose transferase-like glycosyltransferase
VTDEGRASGRLRSLVAWAGIVVLALITGLAALFLAWDAWRVASHVDALGPLRTALVAVAVIAGGVALTAVVAWLAGSGPRGLRTATIVALGVVVIVRIAIAVAYDGVLSGEPGVYHGRAESLASGNCCPWEQPISRPPGYTFVLAAAYALGGPTAFAAEALNIGFAVATGLIVLALARHAYGGPAGAVALLLYGLWPAGALMVVVRIPHSVYDLAFVAAAWAVVATPPGWRWSALAGALLGISQYFRPTSFLFLPIFMLVRVWGGGRWRQLLGGAMAPMLLGFLLVLVPIMAWNLSTRGALDISTSSFGGGSLYHGTNLASGGRWSRAARAEMTQLAESSWDQSRTAQAIAIGRIRDDPVGMAALALRKQVTFWGRESYGVRYGIRRDLTGKPWAPAAVLPTIASGTFYVGLLAFTVLGLYLRRRQVDPLAALAVLVVLALSLLHGLVEVRDRYHSYAIPLLMPIAATAILAVTEGVRSRRAGRSPPAAGPPGSIEPNEGGSEAVS